MVLSLQKSTFWLLLALQWFFILFLPFLAFGGALLIRYHQALVGFLNGFFDGCLTTYYFLNFGGDLPLVGFQHLVELCLWWSFFFTHGSAFAQWWGFLCSYYCCCAHLVRCGGAMDIGIGQFTQQCSSVSKSLTCYA